MAAAKLRHSALGQQLADSLAEIEATGSFADVKIVCGGPDGKMDSVGGAMSIFWGHKLVLASVSPFLKELLAASEEAVSESVVTLLLPDVRGPQFALLLDYIYTGVMNLPPGGPVHVDAVVRLFEMLRMTCGVSVSKRSRSVEEKWLLQNDVGYLNQMSVLALKREFDEHHEELFIARDFSMDGCDIDKKEHIAGRAFKIDVKEDVGAHDEPSHSSSVSAASAPSSRPTSEEELKFSCVMCGERFRQDEELKSHLQGHLGVKMQLQRCNTCKRNFRSSLEYDLHMNTHRLSRFFSNGRRASKQSLLCDKLRNKLVRNAVRKLGEANRRRFVAKREKKQQANGDAAPTPSHSEAAPLPANSLKLKMKVKLDLSAMTPPPPPPLHQCPDCDRSFGAISSLKRHQTTQHSKKVSKTKTPTTKASTKKAPMKKPAGTTAPPRKRAKMEDELTCPTCDKTFLAKSIFERHLRTSRHGAFAEALEVASPTPVAMPTPHLNLVVQPKMDVGGVQMNKYECHLCGKVFVRVKDLAKHRAKTCSAWLGGAVTSNANPPV